LTAWALQAQIDRLYRRILMGVAPVQIAATDDSGPIHKAQILVNDTPETIDNVGVMQIYGLASHAMAGSDATALFIHGHRDNPVIVATGNQQYRLRNLKPGEIALYDNNGSIVKLATNGDVEIISASGTVTIAAKNGNATVKITGDLQVTGEITRGEGTSDSVTLGQHTHDEGAKPDPGT
jgi:phage gp45-like